ncbi:hypothetical protein Aph02nite_42320 [Actinoplanes philippinensis]|nr:hypothetical protein Aph02nite_42320 [Actinoplanes philippinensis]
MRNLQASDLQASDLQAGDLQADESESEVLRAVLVTGPEAGAQTPRKAQSAMRRMAAETPEPRAMQPANRNASHLRALASLRPRGCVEASRHGAVAIPTRDDARAHAETLLWRLNSSATRFGHAS